MRLDTSNQNSASARMRASLMRIRLLSVCLVLACASPAWAQKVGSSVNITSVTPTLVTGGLAALNASVTSTDLSGWAGASIQFTGTCTGCTAQFLGSADSVNYQSLIVTPINGASGITSTTAAGAWTASVAGLSRIRVTLSGYSSGSWVVSIRQSLGAPSSQNTINVSSANAAAIATGTAAGSIGYVSYTGANTGGTAQPLTALPVGSQNAMTVAIVDASGNQITSFGGAGGTASNVGSAVPSVATATGFSDGTLMQLPRVYDTDSGGGTQYTAGVNLRKIASGGSVEAGTSTDPLRVDPTGTTPQPATQSGTWNIGTVTTVSSVASATVVGNVAGAATDSGNPVKVGGVYNTSLPTLTNGQRGNAQLDANGRLLVNVDAGSAANSAASATGSAVPADADYCGIKVGANLVGCTGSTLGSQNAQAVMIVDGSGNQVTSFGGSGGTASNIGSAFPSVATAAGFSDGTNMQGARVFDADTGGGTQYVVGVELRASGSGGSTEIGTAAAPIRVDPTGTTTQPVSVASVPTHAVTQSGSWTVQPGNVANTTAWLVKEAPYTPVLVNGLSTTVTTVTGSAATLGSYYCYNPNSSVAYVQIFDISGSVTLGSSAPKWSIGIPGTGGANLPPTVLTFANAIKVAATTTATGSTAPGTALDCNFSYR